ncbi:MAG: protein translocase subunit SecDF, partial [Patescibacteria group bacterium]|nr:protein translocase subunit SecDF [Patescibacteria group bacterium]
MFNAEIDAMFITAILTVLGFSVHDTIVVFDRFRENLMGNMKSTVPKLANEALNQTLARSLNTSITILITLLALLFFAGNSIFYFVLTLVIGTIIGTYSSIFLATPFLSKWIDHGLTVEEMMKKKKKEAGI